MTTPALDRPAAVSDDAFEAHRRLLFGIAYRMVGSAVEAEDLVQETYLRMRSAGETSVANTRAYLVTILTRLCLDHLKSARRQRELYPGPWLPEPLPTADLQLPGTPEARIDAEESISLAFLVLLETLGPVERAVLLLRDVFDYGYDEVASIVGRNEPACRQILRRARKRIDDRRPRYRPSQRERDELTQQFILAAGSGDMDGLLRLLARDVVVWSDGGGKVAAALNPVAGAERVARFILGVTAKEQPKRAEVSDVNGAPALITGGRTRVYSVLQLEADAEGRICAIRIVRNPEKLSRFA